MSHEIYALTMLIYFILTGKTNTSKITNPELNKFVEKGLGNRKLCYKNVDELCCAYKNLGSV